MSCLVHEILSCGIRNKSIYLYIAQLAEMSPYVATTLTHIHVLRYMNLHSTYFRGSKLTGAVQCPGEHWMP